jgi:putative endonuclease
MKHNQSIGKWGEEKAAQFLLDNGYAILARNWKSPYGELDLIARKDEVISIIEVKTRTGTNYGWPEEAVTLTKQQHLINAGQVFMEGYTGLAWQIDVIAVLVNKQPEMGFEIKHYENAVSDL